MTAASDSPPGQLAEDGPHACTFCKASMVRQAVSPCMECGGDPREIRMLQNEAHSYHLVRVLGLSELVLCDFCQIDFGTYSSYFFGMPRNQHLGFNDLRTIQSVEPRLGMDWVCTACGYRQAFATFVLTMRAHFQSIGQ